MTAELSAERKVLGAVLAFGGDALALVLEAGVTREAFFHDDHGRLWALLEAQSNAGAPLETLAICTLLMSPGQDADRYGGVGYVSSLADDVPALNSVGWFARQLLDLDSRRRLKHLASWLEAQATSGRPVDDVVASAASMLDRVNAAEQADSVVDGAGLAGVALQALTTDRGQPPTLDDGGMNEVFRPALRQGITTLVCARPGVGKTAAAMNIMYRLAMAEDPMGCVFLSMEQPREQISMRCVSISGAAPYSRLIDKPDGVDRVEWHGEREWGKIMDELQRLADAPVIIDDRSSMTLPYIRSRLIRLARKMPQQYGTPLRLVVFDYIQRAKCPPADNYSQSLGLMAKGLANLARDLKLSMIILSQLNRSGDPTKPPTQKEIRGSGELEEAADGIVAIWRPGHGNPSRSDDTMSCASLKNRHGKSGFGTIDLEWRGSYLQIGSRQVDNRSTAEATMRGSR